MGIEITFPGVERLLDAANPARHDRATAGLDAWAGPSTRKFAREFGVDIQQVRGSGQRGRITKEDVQQFIKRSMLARESSVIQETLADTKGYIHIAKGARFAKVIGSAP